MGGLTFPGPMTADRYIGGRIQTVDPATGTVTDLYTECDGRPLLAPNDLVFDAHGGFYFTDHGMVDDEAADPPRSPASTTPRPTARRSPRSSTRPTTRTASACRPTARRSTGPRRGAAASCSATSSAPGELAEPAPVDPSAVPLRLPRSAAARLAGRRPRRQRLRGDDRQRRRVGRVARGRARRLRRDRRPHHDERLLRRRRPHDRLHHAVDDGPAGAHDRGRGPGLALHVPSNALTTPVPRPSRCVARSTPSSTSRATCCGWPRPTTTASRGSCRSGSSGATTRCCSRRAGRRCSSPTSGAIRASRCRSTRTPLPYRKVTVQGTARIVHDLGARRRVARPVPHHRQALRAGRRRRRLRRQHDRPAARARRRAARRRRRARRRGGCRSSDEDGTGIWHRRYYLDGTHMAARADADEAAPPTGRSSHADDLRPSRPSAARPPDDDPVASRR